MQVGVLNYINRNLREEIKELNKRNKKIEINKSKLEIKYLNVILRNLKDKTQQSKQAFNHTVALIEDLSSTINFFLNSIDKLKNDMCIFIAFYKKIKKELNSWRIKFKYRKDQVII